MSSSLAEAAHRGEMVNTVFEERLFSLTAVLQAITEALAEDGIEHEVIGGMSVLIHVEEADPQYANNRGEKRPRRALRAELALRLKQIRDTE